MISAQRELGFDYIFDVNFAADLTIMEEGAELITRLEKHWNGAEDARETPLPMFTSCCPAWINLVEKSFPELIPHLSSCKSPQQMLGAIVKRYFAAMLGKASDDIVLVSIMPCTAKKYEAEREQMRSENGDPDVDYVLTTREFGQMLRFKRIPVDNLEESEFDSPLGMSSGGAILFGASGGVMESALRTAYELITKKPLAKLELEELRGVKGVKTSTVKFPENIPSQFAGKCIRVATSSGIGNTRHLLQDLYDATGARKFDFIEIMACPGGCIGGGGQPKTKDPEAVLKRMGSVYALDKISTIRKAHENKDVVSLYENYLGEPGSEKAHHLLHTHYTDRSS